MSIIFEKTNLLTKSFSALSLYLRTAKLVRKLCNINAKLKFRITVYSARA